MGMKESSKDVKITEKDRNRAGWRRKKKREELLNRLWKSSMRFTEKESMTKLGYIEYPGHSDRRNPQEDMKAWRTRLHMDAMDAYPATGFGNKGFEEYVSSFTSLESMEEVCLNEKLDREYGKVNTRITTMQIKNAGLSATVALLVTITVVMLSNMLGS